jgi:hypothetical protein
MAGAGVMPSGSPMSVLLDSLTQINIDRAIGMANLEQSKTYKLNEAAMSRVEGKGAQRAGTVNAFSSLLNGASDYAMYTKGINTSQGANRAGKQ